MKRYLPLLSVLLALPLSLSADELPTPAEFAAIKKAANPYCRLSPAESLSTFDLAPGYVAELVAAEPDIEEPVLTVFDGNGVMYVAEMRSYMQDVAGTDTKTARNGRIKRLEDTTGDGKIYQAGYMAPGEALGIKRDSHLAAVLSFIRYAWDGEGGPVTEQEVKDSRDATKDRKTPWTQSELEKL